MDDYTFHVGYNWKNDQTVTLVNIPNHYEFEKTDHRHKPLSGVRFGLYDDKGTFIRELVSDENGIVRADNLVPGNYLIRETRPLDGYAKTNEEITFTIDESYVPPQKLVRITNTPVIQTGVDFPVTPTNGCRSADDGGFRPARSDAAAQEETPITIRRCRI